MSTAKIVSEKVVKLYKLIIIAKMEVSQNIEPFLPQEKRKGGGLQDFLNYIKRKEAQRLPLC